jgi:hypothetical protein
LSNVENFEAFGTQTSVLVISLDGEHFLSVVHVQVFGNVCFHQIEVVFDPVHSFLKAYDVPVSKGCFPYEWFDDVLKLEYQSLPPHESFYSSLKQTNISLQDYEFCQRMWVERRMRTFKDFLEWYNNLNVEPFVTVVERLRGYYFERGIDMFKISVSVPRLVRQMLFECGVLLYYIPLSCYWFVCL